MADSLSKRPMISRAREPCPVGGCEKQVCSTSASAEMVSRFSQRDHKYDSCDKTLTSTCGLRPHVLNYHERVSILAWKLLRTSRQRLFNRNHCAIVDAQQLYFMIRVYEMMCKRPEDRPEDWLGILQQTPDPAINRFQSILTARKRKGQQRRGIEQVKRNEEGIEI
ncbi:hypothetical protein M441DRAFT_47216 [Trichoderma asperellum CBS 433.97]|uniref:Uncharacterized protein n=1 Tax=Trichoderma asperellum (strain ATCC 204424 / CBS 433.97 / NBRC 101777) TaxID=1042311 RepID=A0A2T3Z7E4_TRIA4|nr:hypothetical protein M441DRAFT_47216 [Trichoderma asperellum CBS 433.97]PTB40690.1 hypothetical protein M441DRAFT_47216 [Trichoderma asperellum CBS 433.97]